MTIDFETAQINLKKLVEDFQRQARPQKRNEATTRLQLIDTLFFECLGWDKKDCVAEERFEGQYSDYSLSAPNRLLIVEAKKEGTYFELPNGTEKLIYKISFFEKNNSQVYDAIRQALGYCLDRGTPFGCVSNGHQVVAFLGSRTDGVGPLNGNALVFDSLEQMYDEFLQLWQCLSKHGTIAHNLAIKLQEGEAPPPPEKLSKSLGNYPGYKNRNDLQTNLQILGDLIIEDVARATDEVEFLQKCYLDSGALSQYALVSKKILQTRYSSLFEKTTSGPTLKPLVKKSGVNPEALAESISRRPVILLGDVGVGKTMFIRHFINIEADELLKDSIIFYVDFGVQPTLLEKLRPYIADELGKQLRESHLVDIYENSFVRGVYHGNLQQFKKGIYSYLYESDNDEYRNKETQFLEEKLGQKEDHLTKSLEHISKARKKQIIVFLDNIDQRPYEFQQDVFLIAQSMAETWPVSVFISIRPETFYKSKATGSLSAYHPKAFTISPPRIDKVIQKRIEYAIWLLENEQIPSIEDIHIQLASLKSYLKILLYSFRKDDEIIEFIDNVCGGNARLALDFVKIFVGSGHVNTKEILGIYDRSGKYLVALHQFLRAVIHGDHEYFDPNASEILNIFDISTNDGKEHFLASIILALTDRWNQTPGNQQYIPQQTIFEFCQNLGFQLRQIDFSLKRLLTKKLIESNTKALEIDESARFYRITSVGAYYYKRLVKMFAYVDVMIPDTPIVSSDYRVKLTDAHSIDNRINRCKAFLLYMSEQWKLIASQDLPFDWTEIERAVEQNIMYIQGRLSRKDS